MHGSIDFRSRFVVAIPVRDEVERIEGCIRALSQQHGARCDHVVLLLNNCTDGTEALVEHLRPALDVPITMAVRNFAPDLAHAGSARSNAMAIAARIAGSGGIVATTDADGIVDRDWIALTLAAFARGAEVVCGRAVIDPVDALSISPALHADDAREVAYGRLLDEIHALVDPDTFDPWPRHTEHSGASIAATVSAYERAGGMAPLPSGEDRGFLRALRAVDARVRHAPEVFVTVSGRMQGRAVGGMADTMARRMIRQDEMLDADLEPAANCLRRASLRAQTRRLWATRREPSYTWREQMGTLARDAALPLETVSAWLQAEYCGQCWEQIEANSPMLLRVPVQRQALDRHHGIAQRILAGLRAEGTADATGLGSVPAISSTHLALG
jgi:hypothetical protein